jgi:hypothetical protein
MVRDGRATVHSIITRKVTISLNLFSWSLTLHLKHKHLRKMDWLMTRTACLVYLISTVNGHSKKKEEKG